MVYGRGALATPANALTAIRIVCAPLIVALTIEDRRSWLLLSIWLLVSLTDMADGYIARRQGVTSSGEFLDPLADKVANLSALIALAFIGEFPGWAVGVIAARELGISLYRTALARRNLSLPARASAKLKTAFQDGAIAAAYAPFFKGLHPVELGLLFAALALTVVSGLQYLVDERRAARARD